MFLGVLYVAVFIDATYAAEYQCPTVSKMLPCICEDTGFFGLEVSCERVQGDQVRGPLAEVGKTNHEVYYVELERVHIPNLPSNLFVGPVVHVIIVRGCHTSTVEENAFVAVADTLNELYITGNLLKQIPTQALEKLFRLERLYLEDNAIEVLKAEAFKGLQSLLILSLSGNRIKFIDDSALAGIGRTLANLELDVNELTAVPGKPLSVLSSLRILKLNDNKIASLVQEDFDAIGGESLIRLNLANNSIKHVPARVFRSLKKLFTLDLSGNVIDAIHPLAFEGNGDTLEFLMLGYNRLEKIPTASLKNLSRLFYIDLPGNTICKVEKYDFLPCGKTLKFIRLQNNSLKYVDPEAFIGLDVLRSLSLQSNQLNTASFETYSPVLDTLWEFDMHENPLHCDCNVSWLADWINGNGSRVVVFANETICSTPQEHTKKLLAKIPWDQLVCGNSTFILSEPCCNCFTNHQNRLSGDGFTNLLQLLFILLKNVVLGKSGLF